MKGGRRVLVAVVLALSVAPAHGQSSSRLWPLCIHDHPSPRCGAVLLYGVEYQHRVTGSSAIPDGSSVEHPPLPSYGAVSLTFLSNRSTTRSLGVRAEYGGATTSERFGARVVMRKWLEGGASIDLAPGVIRSRVPGEIDRGGGFRSPAWRGGVSLAAALHAYHFLIFTGTVDLVPRATSGTRAAAHVGVGMDGAPAVAISGLVWLLSAAGGGGGGS